MGASSDRGTISDHKRDPTSGDPPSYGATLHVERRGDRPSGQALRAVSSTEPAAVVAWTAEVPMRLKAEALADQREQRFEREQVGVRGVVQPGHAAPSWGSAHTGRSSFSTSSVE